LVKERQGPSRRLPHLASRTLATLLAVLVAAAGGVSAGAERPSFRLTDAAEQGTFNVGPAHAVVGRVPDPIGGGDVLTLEYAIPQGTAAGVWSKAFPAGLSAETVDVVRLGVKADDTVGARPIAVALEIKGATGVQRIPLTIHPGWARIEEAVDWPAIGALTEVVVLVSRVGDGEPAVGTVSLDSRFERLPPLRKLSTSPAARFGGVLLASLLVASLTALLRALSGGWRGRAAAGAAEEFSGRMPPARASWLGHLRRDFVQGAGAVFIAVLGVAIYLMGAQGPLEVGWTALGVAVAGAAIAEWWKYGLTGRHLTAPEVFRDMLATGLLAASASRMALLQPPSSWIEILRLSQAVAAVAALAYLAANAQRLASRGRHLGVIGGGLFVATPFVVGGLTLLESGGLLRALGGVFTAETLAARPEVLEFVGRVLVIFGFNEAVAQGLSLATKRTPLRSARAHVTLLAVAAAATAAPWIAAYGSGATVAGWHVAWRLIATVATTILSQAGLWAEAYLITGMALDAFQGKAPSRDSAAWHPVQGMRKGMVFSGTFMGILYVLGALGDAPFLRQLAASQPMALALLGGALAFPLLKTIIESFDGSQAFFRRVGKSYRDPTLYLRGAVVGLGLGVGISLALAEKEVSTRAWFGFGVGVAAYAGVDLLRDLFEATRRRGRVQAARVYVVHALLGGFIGAALGFYLDAPQVAVVIAKFHRYLGAGRTPEAFGAHLLLSKWGEFRLGDVTGGASLLFAEALAGVITWSVAAWLFAINRAFMAAFFRRDAEPIRALVTRDGLIQFGQNMIEVMRWGLWMSPIINSFLRPVGEPTWYNQDGAIRTLVAIVQDATLSPEAFRAWSLNVFIALLAYDAVRILIWLDHMGLRVATLVNLSFLGMDRLEGRLSRVLAPAATARCIPEGVKRFTTWAPLLIPFYIPRGTAWDVAWSRAQAIQGGEQGGLLVALASLPLPQELLLLAGAVVASTVVVSSLRWLRGRSAAHSPSALSLSNTEYEVTLREDGAVSSRVPGRDYDVSRRSYDLLDPAGRALFLVDIEGGAGHRPRSWPVIGNFPGGGAEACRVERTGNTLTITTTTDGLRATIEIALAGTDDPAEIWTITVENQAETARRIKVVPYLEWVLNRPDADRGHTQYNRLFAEMEYVGGLQSILAWDKHSRAMGLLASDVAPEGFLTSRIDFIGRARSLWTPRVLETMAFSKAQDTDAHPTLDPIGSLLIGMDLPSRGSSRVRLLIGLVEDKGRAIDLIARHLQIPGAGSVPATRRRTTFHPIGHGEIPPGASLPYSEFSEDGRRLLVRTPMTPRPYDHVLSNGRGHIVAVTNRGLHTTASVNAQQNRLTPDCPDIVTREVPGEAFYLYDPDARQWFSPTYHPLNDASAAHEAEFGVDGSATFRMTRGTLETELTVFVPPEEPAGVYLLTVRNGSDAARRLRLAPYFQMVLADQPEHSGPLRIRPDRALNALFFENPRNPFRTGPAFVAISCAAECVETRRGRFFGRGRGVAHPFLVERGEPDSSQGRDDRPIAAFLTTLEIPARGERTVVVVLGQADDRAQAEAIIRKYQDPDAAVAGLEETRRWWLGLMETLQVQTASAEFDRTLDWLKYQALAERIWARRGFYQASGAYGFRDQLQDSVNLIWMDPAVARRQLLLHASQQFLEGDVVHWFHRLQDGRTGFAARTHASDNLLWLAWGVVEYVGATGDETILEERTPYLEAEQPFEPLPAGKHGMGFDPLRSSRDDTVYRHCLEAIDLVLERRMGAHGLPLIGTGDWNDGLDEIGSQGRGESVWLGFFLYSILDRMAGIVGRKDGRARHEYYLGRLRGLEEALERTWRDDRYLRAIHDDGTEIGVRDSGVWEIDALTAAWAVIAGINPRRGEVVFETALGVLEKETTILLGWPPLREETRPYLGRSSGYPEGVRENGMYSHGVQWLVGAARILAGRCEREGRPEEARRYIETAYRLWLKISPIPHVAPAEIETYGGQPNKQAADMVTTFDPGRMIWHGYTGAAGWMFRQALEGVLGLRLVGGAMVPPADPGPAGDLGAVRVSRDLAASPLPGPAGLRPPAQDVANEQPTHPI
jgi:cyclic beta-1,2-glucan synthetase